MNAGAGAQTGMTASDCRFYFLDRRALWPQAPAFVAFTVEPAAPTGAVAQGLRPSEE